MCIRDSINCKLQIANYTLSQITALHTIMRNCIVEGQTSFPVFVEVIQFCQLDFCSCFQKHEVNVRYFHYGKKKGKERGVALSTTSQLHELDLLGWLTLCWFTLRWFTLR